MTMGTCLQILSPLALLLLTDRHLCFNRSDMIRHIPSGTVAGVCAQYIHVFVTLFIYIYI